MILKLIQQRVKNIQEKIDKRISKMEKMVTSLKTLGESSYVFENTVKMSGIYLALASQKCFFFKKMKHLLA